MSLTILNFANGAINFQPKCCIYTKILLWIMSISGIATLLLAFSPISLLYMELLTFFVPVFFLSFFCLYASFFRWISWSLYSNTDKDGKTREIKVSEFYEKIAGRDQLFYIESLTIKVWPGENAHTVTTETLAIFYDKILLHSWEKVFHVDFGRSRTEMIREIQAEKLPERLKLSLEEMT